MVQKNTENKLRIKGVGVGDSHILHVPPRETVATFLAERSPVFVHLRCKLNYTALILNLFK